MKEGDKSTTTLPTMPYAMMFPLDVAGIGVTVLLCIGFLILVDWLAALAAVLSGLVSWLHLHLLLVSFNRFGKGGLGLHMLWMIIRLFILGGAIVGILLMLPGNALAVVLGVVMAATAGCFGVLVGVRRLNQS